MNRSEEGFDGADSPPPTRGSATVTRRSKAPVVGVEAARQVADRRRSRRQAERRRSAMEWVVIVVVAVVVALLVRSYVLEVFEIPSGSMEPTLVPGDRVLVFRPDYLFHPVHRGDIVVFHRPPADKVDVNIAYLVKRVIGLPGETISSADGHVLINGHILREPYLPPGTVTTQIKKQVIPAGDVFLMGDNRSNSYDSRFFGPVPEKLIVGRVIAIIWPFGHFRLYL